MSFKKVEFGDTVDIKEKEGKFCEGVYMGSKEVDTNLGTSLLYKFEGTTREVFSVWGFTSLDIFMENVVVGTLCRITYKGLSEKKNKYGKHTHMCLVEIDDGDVVPVGEITKATQVADANAKAAMVKKHFGEQAVPNTDELEAMDFFEFMLEAKKIFKKSTGSDDFFNDELKKKYDINFLRQVRGDTDTQAEIRGYFKELLTEAMGSK